MVFNSREFAHIKAFQPFSFDADKKHHRPGNGINWGITSAEYVRNAERILHVRNYLFERSDVVLWNLS